MGSPEVVRTLWGCKWAAAGLWSIAFLWLPHMATPCGLSEHLRYFLVGPAAGSLRTEGSWGWRRWSASWLWRPSEARANSPTTRRLVLPWLRHLPSALPFQATLSAPSSPPAFTSFTESLSFPRTDLAPVSLWPVLPLFSVPSPAWYGPSFKASLSCLGFPLPLPLQIQFSDIPVPSWLDAAALTPVTLDLVIEFFVHPSTVQAEF